MIITLLIVIAILLWVIAYDLDIFYPKTFWNELREIKIHLMDLKKDNKELLEKIAQLEEKEKDKKRTKKDK